MFLNTFMNKYLREKCPLMDKQTVSKLIKLLCDWMEHRSITKYV